MPGVEQSKNAGTTVGVTTASSVIVPRNGGRVSLLVVNTSSVTIFIALASTAAVTNLPIEPGDSFSLSIDGSGYIYTGPISAIHGGTGTHNVHVVEV